jgi:predicted nucleic acid-binding protein
MILLDTSVLIDGLTGHQRCAPALRSALERRERIVVPTLVLYEWLRGPRLTEEIEAQEALFPSESAPPFGPHEARLAAELYKAVPRARGREIDLAIAACAISWNSMLWTLNLSDFDDIPGLAVTIPE